MVIALDFKPFNNQIDITKKMGGGSSKNNNPYQNWNVVKEYTDKDYGSLTLLNNPDQPTHLVLKKQYNNMELGLNTPELRDLMSIVQK